jgi:hypothetical protein
LRSTCPAIGSKEKVGFLVTVAQAPRDPQPI